MSTLFSKEGNRFEFLFRYHSSQTDYCFDLYLQIFLYFYQAVPTAITDPTPSEDKLAGLTLIEKRLDNWFVRQSQSSVQFTGNVKNRWDSLKRDVDTANTAFAVLNIEKTKEGVITGNWKPRQSYFLRWSVEKRRLRPKGLERA